MVPDDTRRMLLQSIFQLYYPAENCLLDPLSRPEKLYKCQNVSSQSPQLSIPYISQSLSCKISSFTDKKTKSIVMFIGSTSSGKSTLANWFVKQYIQKTGMAIETNGFTLITPSSSTQEYGGEITLSLYPFLQRIADRNKGLIGNLNTKTCTTADGNNWMKNVILIDTPGIIEGNMESTGFDVCSIVKDLSDECDLIFVLFDPLTCLNGHSCLMDVVGHCYNSKSRVIFVLSKIDEVPREEDRLKIFLQMTRIIGQKIIIRKGFDLIPVYIPLAKEGNYLSEGGMANIKCRGRLMIANRICELHCEMKKLLEKKIEDSFFSAWNDCLRLQDFINGKLGTVDDHIDDEEELKSKRRIYATSWWILSFFMPLVILISVLYHLVPFRESKLIFSPQYLESQWFSVSSGISMIAWYIILKYLSYRLRQMRPLSPNLKVEKGKLMSYKLHIEGCIQKLERCNQLYLQLNDERTSTTDGQTL